VTVVEPKKTENKMATRFNEKNLEVTFNSYSNFFLSSKYNYILIPITFVFFFGSEAILTMYYRFLADFDNVSAGTSSYFIGNFDLYWGIQGLLIGLYFIVIIVKIYMLYSSLLNASAQVHENMIESIVRCPGKFFDTTPSGILVNKFSTDLGIIDNTMIFGLIDAL
jgi:ATP-binding cassette, subfamily C (CFTR/MRP), member 4